MTYLYYEATHTACPYVGSGIMSIFGVKIPWWVLALLALLVGILVVIFVGSTIVSLLGLLFKIAGLIALVLAAVWAYDKFVRRS